MSAGPDTATEGQEATRSIRGSSVLLGGRVLSLGVNAVTQLLLVRTLAREDFGVFAYGLSVVAMGQTIVLLGLDRGVSRFVAIFDERREYGRAFGILAVTVAAMAITGAIFLAVVFALQGSLFSSFTTDPEATRVLLVLVLLAPLQALDEIVVALLAVFAQHRAIFLRRHVLGPGLRLLTVVGLIVTGAGVLALAAGYVISGLVGVLLYGALTWRTLRRRQILGAAARRERVLPFRELAGFCGPLLSTDLVTSVTAWAGSLLLGVFRGPREVAALMAVLPFAKLNQVALQTFSTLYTPSASRMFARRDMEGLERSYWTTAMWVAVLSFPVFAVTFALAAPVTVLLFGDGYADSAGLLAVLTLGYYLQSSLGPNGTTLAVFHELRWIVGTNVGVAVANVLLNLVLIPAFGAMGAAIAMTLSLVLHNVLKQLGLHLRLGIRPFPAGYRTVYVTIGVAAAVLAAITSTIGLPAVDAVAVAVATVLVTGLAVGRLRIGEIFPELLRFRLVRIVLTAGKVTS